MPKEYTTAQKELFQPGMGSFNFTGGMVARSSKLREGYLLGQAWFRGFINRDNHIENFNDLQQLTEDMEPTLREGVFMGWQSDAHAHDNNMQESVEGGTYWEPEEVDYGYSVRAEGSKVLDGSDF